MAVPLRLNDTNTINKLTYASSRPFTTAEGALVLKPLVLHSRPLLSIGWLGTTWQQSIHQFHKNSLNLANDISMLTELSVLTDCSGQAGRLPQIQSVGASSLTWTC